MKGLRILICVSEVCAFMFWWSTCYVFEVCGQTAVVVAVLLLIFVVLLRK